MNLLFTFNNFPITHPWEYILEWGRILTEVVLTTGKYGQIRVESRVPRSIKENKGTIRNDLITWMSKSNKLRTKLTESEGKGGEKLLSWNRPGYQTGIHYILVLLSFPPFLVLCVPESYYHPKNDSTLPLSPLVNSVPRPSSFTINIHRRKTL